MMKHEEKLERMRKEHEDMARRIRVTALSGIHPGVNKELLEDAYERIAKEYVWTLKRIKA
ncbi:MAG: hypothetical protein KGH94_03875 [Candidatus Micrarchaeota archaeon]|nr:hypothetical protein [Candidatus Micrarchaeota archaeon]